MSFLKCEESAAGLVTNLFISNPQDRRSYHNLLHTIKVVYHVKEIAAFYTLDESDLCGLVLAAWFHDVGHLFPEDDAGYEQRSIIIMNSYLKSNPVPMKVKEKACKCIMAAKWGPELSSLTEKIISDAVTYDYGTLYFREASQFIKNETTEETVSRFCPDEEIAILKNHIYYTEYCQIKLTQFKLENIRWLKSLA